MTDLIDEPQFVPYQQYLSSVKLIEDFAEQSRFCYQITQRFMQEPAEVPAEDDVFSRTADVLNTSCFLMEWMFFEAFLKNTIYVLLHQYPNKLAANSPDMLLNYREISQATHAFSAIDQLRNQLIIGEIERSELHSQSIHGLIDYVRRVFRFQLNPYEIEYLYKGQKNTTSPRDLDDIRAMHKSITADMIVEGDPSGIPGFPGIHQHRATINEDAYLRAKAILNTTAATIADVIVNNWYDPD
ncbi:MAG: hypothetical protein HC822_23285 [Oscillochloris sp.]|nr:hypothetical protein [Oscillochloris sp.]